MRPLVSVVIPSFNRRERLRVCLEALSRQTLDPEKFEVVVVDDGSSDGTHEMVSTLSTPFRLRIVRQANGGPAAARNAGVEQSAGRWCLFLDDDIVVAPNVIEEHLRFHLSSPGMIGLGKITLAQAADADPLARSFAEGWHRRNEALSAGERPVTWEDCFTGNLSVSREAILRVGGFDPRFRRGEDVEFGYRLEAAGLVFHYLREAVAVQHDQKGCRALLEDAFQGGVAAAEIMQRHPATRAEVSRAYGEVGARMFALRAMLTARWVPIRSLVWAARLAGDSPRTSRFVGVLHSSFYWRGVRSASSRESWRQITHRTPILMYHAFAENGGASRYVIPVRRFRSHLRVLRWLGYRVISLEEYLEGPRPADQRVAVLTIDDGYRDVHTHVLPELKRFGYSATVFLVSGRIGSRNDWDASGAVAGRATLSRSQILEMRDAGVRFGAHTRSHPRLTELSRDQAEAEVVGSIEDLERLLDRPIRTFAYPYGEQGPETLEVIAECGLDGACGVDPGFNTPGTPAHRLRRIEVYGTDSAVRFLLKLTLGWSGTPPPDA
jgi:GT2 family glycosyltransferase/peptidoglycan/xylan/chitin deacetylase (PgdA/CDA1 family)